MSFQPIKITVYKKEGCPKCTQAKDDYNNFIKFLEEKYTNNKKIKKFSIQYFEYNSMNENEKNEVQNRLKPYNNNQEYNYYPKIFINKEFIGGADKFREKIKEISKNDETLLTFFKKFIYKE
jgi:glutaredoxin